MWFIEFSCREIIDGQDTDLSCAGLDQVGWEEVADEIHEHVGSGYVSDGASLDDPDIGSLTGMDGEDEDDAEDDGAHRGGHVVDDGSRADATRHGQVQRADGGNHGRDDQGQNEHLQHAQKQIT